MSKIKEAKDGLISESFPLWLKSPSKGANSQPKESRYLALLGGRFE